MMHIEMPLQISRRGLDSPIAPVGDRYVLQGESRWLLTGPKSAIDSAAGGLVGVSERITDEVLFLDFGNAVGHFDVPGVGRIEVVSGKWTRDAFDHMLAELTDIAAGLPFSAGSAAALPYDRSVTASEDLLYHMFVYLRRALSNTPSPEERLLPALNLVLHDPHRRFEQLRREVPVELARYVDPLGLSRIIGGRGGFTRVGSEFAARSSLARSLLGYLPDKIDERYTEVTFDTPENRFVKLYLETISGVIDAMRRLIEDGRRQTVFGMRVIRDCDHLARTIQPIQQHPMWDHIGPMVHLPASSPVLQRRRGYREIFRHFSKMRLATRVPLDHRVVEDLLEAKDIAQLYEIWCYFVLAREITGLLGSPIRSGKPRVDQFHVTVPWDMEIAWSNNTRLLYNPRFSRSHPNRYSYSVPLRPDIALEVDNDSNVCRHLFDAKFKVDRVSSLMSTQDNEDVDADEEAEERKGTFKRGDLYKMHAYHDAIGGVQSVWILYPGAEFRFFDSAGRPAPTSVSLPKHPRGVGALPMLPDDSGQLTLKHVLTNLLGGNAESFQSNEMMSSLGTSG